MRRSIIAVALAGALAWTWMLPAEAQQNGIVIENNGVNSSNSAAGADNVRVSHNPGNSQSANGAGTNNEAGARAPKERNRKDRGSRNSGEAAPAEAAPAEGDYQGYAEPAAVPAEGVAPETAAQAAAPETAVVKLPSTGVGSQSTLPWAAFAAVAAVAAWGAKRERRRYN